MYSVFVEELEFYGHHGVTSEEQTVGHRFLVDATVTVDSEVPTSDDVADTIDYGLVAQTLVDIGTGRRYKTVEALSAAMCSALLDSFPLAQEVTVTLSKLLPPISHVAGAAGVSVMKSRRRVK